MSSPVKRLQCIANHCAGVGDIPEKAFTKGQPCPPLKPGVLRLYGMRFCPFAQRARLVLVNKNIPFEIVNVNLKYKPDWFWEKNPSGVVPVLEIDGTVVYESTAACEWLDDTYTVTSLQPTDRNRKAQDRMLLEYFGKVIDAYYSFLRKPQEREKAITNFHKGFQYYEDALSKRGGPFFGGTSPAMIDFYLWPHLERVPALATREPRLTVDRAKYPKLAQWFDAMYRRSEVKATITDIDSHLKFHDSLFKIRIPNYDIGLTE